MKSPAQLVKVMAATLLVLAATANAQPDRRAAIDVDGYKIQATVDPAQQTLSAKAQVTFTPQEDRVSTATFELNNALNLNSVTDSTGQTLQTARGGHDYSVRVSFPQPLTKGTPVTLVFDYSGRMAGTEDSPVYGISFAAIKADRTYLLYPARWFPISGYTSDRYQMELTVSVPAGFKVISSGLELPGQGGTTFKSTQPGFYGSLAVVQGSAQRINAEGVTTDIWFRPERHAVAQAIGEETAKQMVFFTGIYGVPPQRNLVLVETGDGAPNGYAAPGILFLSPAGIGKQPSQRLLSNQITRQWFGNLISPVNRNHIWIVNGMARYAEIMYQEHLNGPSALESEIHDLYVDALTVTDAPVRQAARYDDYSPEFFAVTGSKGAATYNMLRWIIGDPAFQKTLKTVMDQYANKPISTDDFRKVAEAAGGQNLQGFFIQWLESTGAPEFKMDYTIYRTQKGFRVMGKITQDLDTFRMPVELRIETEGNPEDKRVDVVGPTTDFSVDTFGKPRRVIVDPNGRMLRLSPAMRVAVAIRRGEQFVEISEYNQALQEYQKALEVSRTSSLAHYRVGEVFFLQGNYQSAVNEFREALNGDNDPKWTEVWSHINMGKIFDVTQQRERAVNEYTLAIRTKDNTQGAQEEAAKYRQTPYQRKDTN
ncbi:M1 family aminopeptidase [uncultured Paludibaculum sp.]|uniref:M1 family aminopeptidase n=1 Tax=uncultured Paludibaculum sp. TaxID=1765020 RepID=UPI002AAB8D0A|nr:M1 family aminopeptidase [uncultured Paludibaculum sp.]